MDRAVTHFQNACRIPNVSVYGYLCKTNIQTNTAFRGFGAPQGMLVGETMYRHIAETLGKDILEVMTL
jgi:xanthine dehydrogenase/oxidase